MANMVTNEPYIPLAKREVLERCLSVLAPEQQDQFQRFAGIASAWFHHRFYAIGESLQFDFLQQTDGFATALDGLAKTANFTTVSQQDLDVALAEESTFQLGLEVCFDDFEEVVFYRRGSSQRTASVSYWFGLRRKDITFTNLNHVLLYVRFKPASAFDDPEELSFTPGSSMLKLFENVPQADLEMLFPNTRIRMRMIDKLFIGVPAFISGLIVLTTKIGGTLLLLGGLLSFWVGMSDKEVVLDQAALLALATGLGALGAYLWKQYSNFANRKIRFMKALAENLYFKTLANESGVLSYLIDRAEESETKEVLLAYVCLLQSSVGLDETDLKVAVETLVDSDLEFSFDVNDALSKLAALGIAQKREERWVVQPIDHAMQIMDEAWDKLFEYSR